MQEEILGSLGRDGVGIVFSEAEPNISASISVDSRLIALDQAR